MKKIIIPILLAILLSLTFFPITFKFLPILNTKKIAAAVGLGIFVLKVIRNKAKGMERDMLIAFILSVVFSLLCYMSSVVNDVIDDSYSTYYQSFLVWTFGAYCVCGAFRKYYGCIDLKTLILYLGAVGVAQGVISQLSVFFPGIRIFIDSFIEQGQDFYQSVNRIYGIGASLDSGGVRFCIILILLAFQIERESAKPGKKSILWLLYLEFFIITVTGNAIARITTAGAILGITYILIHMLLRLNANVQKGRLQSFGIFILILASLIPLLAYLYASNTIVNTQLRFAFEGFFNWIETGTFQTDSTDKLLNMWVWPRTDREWFIGTGIFGNWAFGTDIGYCRFTLYCGLLGFSVFTFLFIHCCFALARRFEGTGLLSLMLFALILIIWMKVSTDIYQIFALLFCIDPILERTENETVEE